MVVLREVFFVVVDCCFLELLAVRLRTAEAKRRVALTIEPTENQGILNLDFASETAGIFQTRKQDSDYPGKAYTVGRKLSLGWRYVEWNEKNSCFRSGKRDKKRTRNEKISPIFEDKHKSWSNNRKIFPLLKLRPWNIHVLTKNTS